MAKINIKQADYSLLKTFLDLQIIIEDLDHVNEDVRFKEIKQKSNQYLKWLEREVVPIITETFKTNPDLVNELISNVRNGSNKNKEYFNIIK